MRYLGDKQVLLSNQNSDKLSEVIEANLKALVRYGRDAKVYRCIYGHSIVSGRYCIELGRLWRSTRQP